MINAPKKKIKEEEALDVDVNVDPDEVQQSPLSPSNDPQLDEEDKDDSDDDPFTEYFRP